MLKVVLLGSGNVAQHLIKAFATSNTINLVQVYSRQAKNFANYDSQKITNIISELVEADLYIIAVSDAAITSLSQSLPFQNKLVVHTAGAVALSALDVKNRRGVFYPLQSFSAKANLDYSQIPMCLEAENQSDYEILTKVAQSFSSKIYEINSKQRLSLHLSAVFVNNFVNHLYHIGNEICQQNQISFEILHPIIAETSKKIKNISPQEAQTGPAIRHDIQTINTHLQQLKNPQHIKIYKTITQSIQNNGTEL